MAAAYRSSALTGSVKFINASGLSFFLLPGRARIEVEPIFRLRNVTVSQDASSHARLEAEPIFGQGTMAEINC